MTHTSINSISNGMRIGPKLSTFARAIGIKAWHRQTSVRSRHWFRTHILGTAVVGTLSLGMSTVTVAGQGYMQAADLKVFGDPTTTLDGAVTLQRRHRSLQARISANSLDPLSAYTAWWVVFNNPQACEAEPCTGDDLRNPAVSGANFYATGFITGNDGIANVDVKLNHGRVMRGVEFIDFDTGVPPRLKYGNGLRAEIHLVLRSHGPVEPGRAAMQISRGEFGECDVCANQQSAIFLPVR